MNDAVVISGGTRGLGRSLALAFGATGFAVTSLYKADAQAADQLLAEFEARGITGQCLRIDIGAGSVTLPEGAYGTGRLVLVNNAWPAFEPKPFHLTEWRDFEDGFRVGVGGAVALTRAVLPLMVKARSGVIVNVLTTAAQGAAPKGFSAYVAAKYALSGLAKSVASEYRARGVRVFCVAPGFMETALTERWDARLRALIVGTQGKPGNPDEVARAVLGRVQDPETPGEGETYLVP
jgi:3-oxoacyl-[acyl-carrier protein] reductase